jgi:hypothetical protein
MIKAYKFRISPNKEECRVVVQDSATGETLRGSQQVRDPIPSRGWACSNPVTGC